MSQSTLVHIGDNITDDEQAELFLWKRSMGQFVSGVTVITTADPKGNPLGTTVSAFSSVSLRPRLLLVCLDQNSRTLAAIRQHGSFAVNVLTADAAELAYVFARKGDQQFVGIPHNWGALGCPLLEQVCTRIECHIDAIHEGGDHCILVGRPEGVQVMDEAAPLVYHGGQFIL
ncbi:flavin reductase family protein [Pseudomonas sp. ADAK13]|uniref:flavin reductase family protein n=1 Tax=Pseudomonas sp. ADAK13 TaxID=2730847 RepID=UPI0014628626|nr:flavin reductase family protein [Pseudomonas sp. ADAK13]QJI37100.1 flavin reductase family protein [Pseudomonas sp. ADAK13]